MKSLTFRPWYVLYVRQTLLEVARTTKSYSERQKLPRTNGTGLFVRSQILASHKFSSHSLSSIRKLKIRWNIFVINQNAFRKIQLKCKAKDDCACAIFGAFLRHSLIEVNYSHVLNVLPLSRTAIRQTTCYRIISNKIFTNHFNVSWSHPVN